MKSGEFIIKYRWLIIALSVVITVIFGLQIFRADIDPDLEKYIPPEMPSRLSTEKIEEIFGGDELLIVVFESEDVLKNGTLQRLQNIRRELMKLDEADQVLSLYDIQNMTSEEGMLRVEPFIHGLPLTTEETEKLREDLLHSEMARNIVVSEDFNLTTIILSIKAGTIDDEIVSKVQDIITKYPGSEKVYLGGLPYFKTIIASETARDFKRLMIIGLLFMLAMLYIFFRDIRGVLLPLLVVIFAITFSMGLIPVLGWKLSIITLLLPIMMIAIANDYGIHMIARYQELNWADKLISNGKLARSVYSSLRVPIILTGITTIAGILSLLSHQMIPAKQLGVIAALGILFALVLSLLFIPAVLSFMKKSKVPRYKQNGKKPILDRILEKTGKLVIRKPARVLLITASIVVISGIGIFFLRVDTDLEKFFPEKHLARKSSEIINKTFGGSQNLAVHVQGDIIDPSVMKNIDMYTEALEDYPGVGNVHSISRVIREISKAMNNPGDSMYNAVPDSREAIAQYLELYNMSGNPEDLEKLIDFNYENTQIIIRINDGSNATIHEVLGKARELTRGDPSVKRIGGYGYVVAQLADIVVRGQVLSLLIALIIIAGIITVIFRSILAGLTTSIPLIVALVFLFGLMGYFGIYLDVATALLSSIMIGVGVDYTIHFLWRYREERMQGLSAGDSIMKTMTTTGRGITFNALSVIIGFGALLFSSFAPIKFFGFLVIVSIFACLVGALIIVPSLILLTRPGFLEPEDAREKGLIFSLRYLFRKKNRSIEA
jgi:hydrophobe/amphiphile efflux-3 (HAE3) family protein